jgi:hypothetical protein
MDSNKKKRKIVGWGYEDEEPNLTITQNILTLLKTAWQIQDFEPLPQADLRKVAAELRKPRFNLTKKIRTFCTDDAEERMRHSYGQAFRLLRINATKCERIIFLTQFSMNCVNFVSTTTTTTTETLSEVYKVNMTIHQIMLPFPAPNLSFLR